MLEVLLTVIPSFCWVLLRCYQLLQTPAERLIRQLNVEIPQIPAVTVDSLGSTNVILHWNNRSPVDENIFYVVMVNGKDAGTLAQTSAKLCRLQPDSLYSIQILAVNIVSNFLSQSPAVHIHTSKETESTDKETPGKKICLMDTSSLETTGSLQHDLTRAEILRMESDSYLLNQLKSHQIELSRVLDDLRKTSCNHEEENALRREIEAYKKELNEESDVKAKKDLDLKSFEKKKDSLTFTKLKLSKQLKNYESHRNLHLSKLAELRLRVAKLVEKRQHALNTAEVERNKVFHGVERMNISINEIKSNICRLEGAIKKITSEKKELSTLLAQLRALTQPSGAPLFPSLNSQLEDVDSRNLDDDLNSDSSPLQELFALVPDWEADINRELEVLHKLDVSWKQTFYASVQEYVDRFNSLEMTKLAKHALYDPKHLSIYQACVYFGGPELASSISNSIIRFPTASKEGSLSPSPPPDSLLYGSNLGLPDISAYNRSESSVSNLQPISNQSDATARVTEGQDNFDFRGAYSHVSTSYPELEALAPNGQNPPNQLTMPASISIGEPGKPSAHGYLGDSQLITGGGEAGQAAAYPGPAQIQTFPSYWNELQDSQVFRSDIRQTTSSVPITQPTSMPMASFNSEPMNASSPPSVHYGLHHSLWNNSSQSSFIESRRPYQGLSLSPSINAENYNQNGGQVGGVGTDNGLFSGLNLPTGASNSIWSDRFMGGSLTHNRTLSSGSHLWRQERPASERSPTTSFVPEFSPFTSNTVSFANFEHNNESRDDYDVRSM